MIRVDTEPMKTGRERFSYLQFSIVLVDYFLFSNREIAGEIDEMRVNLDLE